MIDPADGSYDGKCIVTASGEGVKDDTVEINVVAKGLEFKNKKMKLASIVKLSNINSRDLIYFKRISKL